MRSFFSKSCLSGKCLDRRKWALTLELHRTRFKCWFYTTFPCCEALNSLSPSLISPLSNEVAKLMLDMIWGSHGGRFNYALVSGIATEKWRLIVSSIITRFTVSSQKAQFKPSFFHRACPAHCRLGQPFPGRDSSGNTNTVWDADVKMNTGCL